MFQGLPAEFDLTSATGEVAWRPARLPPRSVRHRADRRTAKALGGAGTVKLFSRKRRTARLGYSIGLFRIGAISSGDGDRPPPCSESAPAERSPFIVDPERAISVTRRSGTSASRSPLLPGFHRRLYQRILSALIFCQRKPPHPMQKYLVVSDGDEQITAGAVIEQWRLSVGLFARCSRPRRCSTTAVRHAFRSSPREKTRCLRPLASPVRHLGYFHLADPDCSPT